MVLMHVCVRGYVQAGEITTPDGFRHADSALNTPRGDEADADSAPAHDHDASISPAHAAAVAEGGAAVAPGLLGCGVFYLSQRPYLVSGTLRDQLLYPFPPRCATSRHACGMYACMHSWLQPCGVGILHTHTAGQGGAGHAFRTFE